VLYIVALFFVKTFWGFFFLGVFVLVLLLISNIPYRYFLRGLRPVVVIVIFTLVLHILFTKGGAVYLRLGSVTVEEDGLYLGGFMTLRLILLVISTTLVTLTTSPIALTDGIEALLSPLRRLGIPAHEIAMMMTIALRFIPTLMQESEKIMKAQMARGADFETGNIFTRARNLAPLLVPLFVSAFRRADELALAMEARCYQGGEGRTRMNELTACTRDYVALAVMAAITAAVIITKI